MKKASKMLGSVALSAALLMGTTAPAFADPWVEGDADFDGSSQSIDVYVDGLFYDTVDAANLSFDGQSPAGYLFKRGNDPMTSTWNVVVAPQYLTLDDLLAKAGADWAWDEGASLEFTCWNEYTDDETGEVTYEEEPYELWTFNYDDLMDQTNWYPDTTVNGVVGEGIEQFASPVIAFAYSSAKISGTAQETFGKMSAEWPEYVANPSAATTYKWQQNTRFLTGLNADTINATDGSNMGKRFPSSITAINVVSAAE